MQYREQPQEVRKTLIEAQLIVPTVEVSDSSVYWTILHRTEEVFFAELAPHFLS